MLERNWTVGVSDGHTLKARCAEPGSYEEITVHFNGIATPEKRQPFGATCSRLAASGRLFDVNSSLLSDLRVQCLGKVVRR